MPIEDWISDPIASERHERVVAVAPERAVELALSIPAGSDPIIGALIRMRGMRAPGASMEDFFRANGFVFLHREPREVVVGIATEARIRPGRTLDDPARWHEWNEPRSIKAAVARY